MKIGVLIGGLKNGGAERVVCNLSNYLSENHDVTIITMSNVESSYFLENKVVHKKLDRGKISSNFIIKNIKRLIELYKIIKKNEYDIYITFLPITSFLLLLFRRKIKVPIIVSVRNDPKIEYKSKISNILMRLLYPLADAFIFQTEDAKGYFEGIISSSSKIIPNPINEEFIIEPYMGERKKEIVSVGRLTEQKNHSLLIESFAKISEKYSDYNLIIYGEGKLRGELESKIKDLNLQNKVRLPGNVVDLKECIYKSSLFILSSNYEGMPNALMEAMAMGIPVISTDCACGGPKFLIENMKNGILIPINCSDSLVEAINMVLENKQLSRDLSNNAAQINQTLNPQKVYKQWEEYILNISEKYRGL